MLREAGDGRRRPSSTRPAVNERGWCGLGAGGASPGERGGGGGVATSPGSQDCDAVEPLLVSLLLTLSARRSLKGGMGREEEGCQMWLEQRLRNELSGSSDHSDGATKREVG